MRHSRMMLPAVLIIAIIALLVALPSIAASNNQSQRISVAYSDITLFVDGNVIIPRDVSGNRVEPFTYNGTTFLPIRAVGNALNKDVDWVSEERSVYLTDKANSSVKVQSELSAGAGKTGTQSIEVVYSDVKVKINGIEASLKDAHGNTIKPFSYNGTLYLPIRALATAFGKSVQWDSATKSVYIGTYERTFFVSPSGSDAIGTGSLNRPWQSVTHARDAVRKINQNMTSDIVIYLREGVYSLTESIRFDVMDSGTNGYKIRYENAPGETPIISGGKTISGWTLFDVERNIYKTRLTAEDRFRQLYVNGKRAVLARTPNLEDVATSGPYYKGGYWNYLNAYESNPFPKSPYYFTIDAANVPDWSKNSPLELVTVDHWRMKMAHIKSFEINGSKAVVNLQDFESQEGTFGHANNYLEPLLTPYYFQNAYELLDAGGEWYLDPNTNELFYKPRQGEDLSSAEIMSPTVESLIVLSNWEGTQPVENLVFKGLTLEYTNWTLPSKYGYADCQTGIGTFVPGYFSVAPGAIQIFCANNITIDSCTIRHTGAHAIVAPDMNSYVSNCVFQNNTTTDTSGGGIFLVTWDEDEQSTGNVIQNNLFEYGGMAYYNSAAVLLTNTPNVKILHNEIGYYGGAGITFGWQWDDKESPAYNIEVAYNKIHDVMRLVDDSAGIYTLGNIPNSSIHDNYIYNIIPSKYQGMNPAIFGNLISGIYLDGGANKTVYSNVIDNTGFAFNAANRPIHGNVIRENYYNCHIGNIGPETEATNNTFVKGTWPAEALDIINHAGIQK